MHWIKFHFTCLNCNYRQLRQMTGNLAREFDKCCPGKPENKMCKPDHATRNDVDDIQGCERYRFAFGLDEMAVNAEIGLYFQFDQINGIPVNCSGFENFTMARWKENTNRYRRAWNHGCGLNMRKEPANAEPVSSYFDCSDDFYYTINILWNRCCTLGEQGIAITSIECPSKFN